MPWLAIAGALVALAAVIAFGIAWLTAPSVGDLQARVHAIDKTSGAQPVSLHRIAPVMREATVATEDERFYSHDGVDVIGVLRALPYDITHLSLAEGASTITEQLAKLVYLGGDDHSPWGKLRDAAIALRIEAAYTKEQILADYLNTVYLGSGAYGVQAAARRYFSEPASRLDLSQAALLAGLIQDPSGDDPIANPADARERQAEALTSMVRNGFATEAEARRALAAPLPLSGHHPLPPEAGLDIVPAPPFYWGELALGLIIGAVGIGGVVARRRGHSAPARVPPVATAVAIWLALAAGAFLVLGSFRGV